jgi:ribonuclease P protein component
LTCKKVYCPLVKKGDFKRVFETGRRFSSRYLVIYASPCGLDISRLGLAVSKKTGSAVIRNRIRRRLRESVRRRLAEQPLRYDFVIVARTAAAEAAFADLDRMVAKTFAGLVNEEDTDSNCKAI